MYRFRSTVCASASKIRLSWLARSCGNPSNETRAIFSTPELKELLGGEEDRSPKDQTGSRLPDAKGRVQSINLMRVNTGPYRLFALIWSPEGPTPLRYL